MKLITTTTIALFSTLALADKYAAGTACHSSVECNTNCLNSQWTLSNPTIGGYAFVCDPDLADGTLYYKATCDLISLTIQVNDREKTTSACTSLGGTSCQFGCVVSGSSRTPDVTAASWKQACAGAGTQLSRITEGGAEALARRRAGC